MSYDETGMTRVTVLGTMHRDVRPEERLQRAVQDTLRGQFDLHGELGRGEDGSVMYLATETASKRLVALKLSRGTDSRSGDEDWFVEVVRKLDASVPALESSCPSCGGRLKSWARFCRHCGADLSGIAQGSGPNTTSDELIVQVRAAARGKYDVLGQMDRAEGGGIVYFAKENRTGKLVALRLQRQNASAGGTEIFQLQQTQVLNDFKESLGVGRQGGTQVGRSDPTLPPETSKESPAVMRPTPVAPVAAPVPGPAPQPMPEGVSGGGRPPVSRNALIAGGLALLAAIALLVTKPWASRTDDPPPPPDTVVETPMAVDSATIRIAVQLPPGATVTVDGIPLTELRVRVAAGMHAMGLSAPGYDDVQQDLEVLANETVAWTPTLVRAARQNPPPAADPPQRKAATRPPPRTTTPADPPPDVTPTVTPQPPAGGAPINERTARNTCSSLFAARDYGAAMSTCTAESNAGSSSAMRTLARLHENGQGTARNLATAASLFQRAGEAGDAYAQYRLGYLMINGIGVRKDERGGNTWLRKAADQDQPDAMYHFARSLEMGRGTGKDMQGAVAMFQRAADLGDPLSQTKLGQLYTEGRAVARDYGVAAEWLTKAANAGFVDAQVMLGEAYMLGRGVPQSDAEARRWLTAASQKGDRRARDLLGRVK